MNRPLKEAYGKDWNLNEMCRHQRPMLAAWYKDSKDGCVYDGPVCCRTVPNDSVRQSGFVFRHSRTQYCLTVKHTLIWNDILAYYIKNQRLENIYCPSH